MKYRTTIAQREAAKRFREKNREKINAKHKPYRITYYQKNKERELNKAREWRKKNPHHVKKKVMEALGGTVCANCGTSDIRILELNHINGGGQKEDKKKSLELGRKYSPTERYYDIIKGRLSKDNFNVLCRVCNSIDYLYRTYGKRAIKESYEKTIFKNII